MNEYGLFEQRSGLGKRGSWTSQGQRITTRHPQLRSQRQVQPDADEEVIEQGNQRFHIRYVDIPRRQSQLPPPPTRQRPRQQAISEDGEQGRETKQKRKVHWL